MLKFKKSKKRSQSSKLKFWRSKRKKSSSQSSKSIRMLIESKLRRRPECLRLRLIPFRKLNRLRRYLRKRNLMLKQVTHTFNILIKGAKICRKLASKISRDPWTLLYQLKMKLILFTSILTIIYQNSAAN